MRGSLRRVEGLDLEREREIIELQKQLAEAKKRFAESVSATNLAPGNWLKIAKHAFIESRF